MTHNDSGTSDRRQPRWGGFLASSLLLYGLIGALLILSITGTLIPQGEVPQWYFRRFGVWAGILLRLRLDNVYHSAPFIILLVLLGLNLSWCTWRRQAGLGRRRDLLLTHIGVLIVLAGGFVTAIWSLRGSLPLTVGEMSDRVEDGAKEFRLPFAVRLDRFTIDRYDSGRIKQFRSDVEIAEGGSPAVRGSVAVNAPLRWKGWTIYQAGYDPENPDYSNLLVSRDPGVPVVYAGFLLLYAGIAWTFSRSCAAAE